MDLEYGIGDRVIQIGERMIGEVIKFYYTTACGQQTMILCDDGRKYHAPSHTFIKEDELKKEMRPRPRQVVISAARPSAQESSQPTIVPHDYRNVKVAEDMTVTIDLEELKKKMEESLYKQIGLNYGA